MFVGQVAKNFFLSRRLFLFLLFMVHGTFSLDLQMKI